MTFSHGSSIASRVDGADERRDRIAADAYALIDSEVRPFLAAGGRLWSKGSRGYPSTLRRMLRGLDASHPVTYATDDALRLDPVERVVEHVVPMKRIIIELVDPRQADPRSNADVKPIAGGPATSPEHLLEIIDRLLVTCWVTPQEHDRLNRAAASHQWDAPDGDGWARYRLAGVVALPLTPPPHADAVLAVDGEEGIVSATVEHSDTTTSNRRSS